MWRGKHAMRNRSGILLIAIGLLGLLLLSGCFRVYPKASLSQDIAFVDRNEKIPIPIGLYISPDSRAYSAEQFVRKDAGMSDDGYLFSTEIGPYLEPNALRSLGRIFQSVKVLEDDDFPLQESAGVNYLMALEIDERTFMDVGKFAFSKKRVNIYLQCRLHDAQGKVLLEKVFDSESWRRTGKGFLAAGLFGNYAREAAKNARKEAGDESLRIDLEALNSLLIEKKQELFRDQPGV
jgi:hypothetical protein